MRYKQQSKLPLPEASKIDILSIAANGDGCTQINGQKWYVPYTQDGDTVMAKPYKSSQGHIHAKAQHYLKQSPHTAKPICPYFRQCGGCKLQHLTPPKYADWKKEQLASLLKQKNINDYILDDVLFLPAQTRRRVTFSLNSQYELCFQQHHSHKPIAITACPLLEKKINDSLPLIQSWLSRYGSLLGRKTKLHIISLNQLELTIISDKPAPEQLIKPLIQLQKDENIGRLCWQDQYGIHTIWQRSTLYVTWLGQQIEVNPLPFLQASQQGEAFLQKKLQEYTQGTQTAIELFCGIGTLSFPLLKQCKKITAYDNTSRAIQHANESFKQLKNQKGQIEFIERDLFRQPLLPQELNADTIVLDPPRAGAKENIEQIILSSASKVIMVSCNLKSFARDTQQLTQAGFRLKRLSMLDQFVYSPHMELIGELIRE